MFRSKLWLAAGFLIVGTGCSPASRHWVKAEGQNSGYTVQQYKGDDHLIARVKRGQLHGRAVIVFGSGGHCELTFVNGKKDGMAKYYRADGVLCQSVRYEADSVVSKTILCSPTFD